MSIEIIDSFVDGSDFPLSELPIEGLKETAELDARRRIEDKLEELRLLREMQEFDFDL